MGAENDLETEVKENLYVSKVEEIKNKLEGQRLSPLGSIEEISYSDLGKVLGIRVSGDVPTNFGGAEIVIAHPDSDGKGWLKPGAMGMILEGKGLELGKIPLPPETVKIIRDVYADYTGKECREFVNQENNFNTFAQMGFYQAIFENNKQS